MKASQILIAVPPGSDSQTKADLAALADSIYNRLQKGDNFGTLATRFSNDVVSAASGGSMPEFALGTLDPAFENIAFSLATDGALSKPFLTNHGFHIVKRGSITSPLLVKNKTSLDAIRSMVEKDGRVNIAKEKLYNTVLAKAGYRQFNVNQPMLYDYLDSIFMGRNPAVTNTVNKSTALFSVGESTKMVNEFVTYSMNNRYNLDGSGLKPVMQLIDEFKKNAVMEYYRAHLEDLNEEFNQQMKELKDGNLFFDIMMKEVWSKAQSDTAGQMEYFNANKSKYRWIYSADAVIFYCGDEEVAKSFKTAVTKDPSKWRELLENYSDKISSDSSRFEVSKIPGAQKATAKALTITNIVRNKDDNSASFAILFKIYTQPGQKTFTDARGDIISDYQDAIDKKWIADLKHNYPVKLSQEVLNSIAK